ncbi:MAG TPA: hypothetical protein VLM89_00055 [Phycisphaerae bacterium]|nr:hypothetical protein [Phycisphaerae bacterium]
MSRLDLVLASRVCAICLTLAGLVGGQTGAIEVSRPSATFENQCLKYVVDVEGHSLHFIDKRTGADYCNPAKPEPMASVRIGSNVIVATAAALDGGDLRIHFADKAVAKLKIAPGKRHFVVDVVSLEGEGVEEFTFVDIPLKLKGSPEEPFASCVLARNLKTNVEAIPQAISRLRATCHKRFGFAGASAAVIGCPTGELREVLKEAVLAAPELPHSTIGGPWAMDSPHNRGSYLFNYYNMTEKTVDDWIALARAAGINQIDFHGGGSFRFGDMRPSPELYPQGYASFKAVIDRLHAAGIKAGLHTYAFFIDKHCPWVTPVPDKRLGKDATFALASDLSADATSVPVVESTEKMSNVTDFFIRNSVTLQIGDELIVYKQIVKQPPYAFTECQRGAHGTKAVAHAAGAKVHHLKECFGLFAPDGDSTLLEEVAAKTAEIYNECGFDMIYLDALDGEDVLGGGENGWHYGSKFTFEICKRLKKPAIMEMSTFHHHLWFVRSRMGAWDHPNRGHKRFVDLHCQANAGLDRQFLPGHLGWWAVKTWTGHQNEPTFADDVEYLLGKCMGHDVGFSIAAGLDPDGFKSNPLYQRMAAMMRQYEELRHKRHFDDATLAALREPGREFTLVKTEDGAWRFRPVVCTRHKVQGTDDPSAAWTVENPFGPQVPRLRIEALMSTETFDSPNARVLTDFSDLDQYTVRAAAQGVTCELAVAAEPVKVGPRSARLTATNSGDKADGAWARVGRVFEPTLNMKGREAIGVWVHGDGGGEVLNFQWRSPPELIHRGVGEHYVIVDFKGWRYFELVELDGALHGQYNWPYGGAYDIYRENVDEGNLKTFDIWCNNLPPGRPVECFIGPIRCLPLVKAKIRNPAIEINGRKVVFPVEMESGSYLEVHSPTDCRLYGTDGKQIAEVKPQGDMPELHTGKSNELRFTCEGPEGVRPRMRVTSFCEGKPFGGIRP